MDKATQLVDLIIKAMSTPPDASFSDLVIAHKSAIEIAKKALVDEFNEGYKKAEKDRLVKTIRRN